MQKVWQWIRDRKTNTIRKWRSTFGVSNNAGPSGDQNDGQYCESLLDVPDGGLQPIGGSDNALSRLRSEKIRQQQRSFFGRISRRLSPRNKSKKDFEESDALLIRSMTNGNLEVRVIHWFFNALTKISSRDVFWFSDKIFSNSFERLCDFSQIFKLTPRDEAEEGRKMDFL